MNKLINSFKNINFNYLSAYQYLFKNFNTLKWNNYVSFDDKNYKKNLVYREIGRAHV